MNENAKIILKKLKYMPVNGRKRGKYESIGSTRYRI